MTPVYRSTNPSQYNPGLRIALAATTALVPLALMIGLPALAPPVLAGPQGGQVVGGQATISTPAPGRTQIDQRTGRAIIDWRGFSVGAGEAVDFRQPGRDSIVLNRVTGNETSAINGNLTANGQVWLVNPNGIMVGPGGRVDVGGFLATTSNIRNEDFLLGRYLFGEASPNSNARVVNRGTIRVGEHGYAALSAAAVENTGMVEAQLGTVVLGGARTFNIDLYGDGLISYQVASPVEQRPDGAAALVDNSGTIRADGGRVLLTARAAKGVIDNVINTSGVIEARSARLVNGEIVIDGGDANVVTASGRLDASGKGEGETGGSVKVLGARVGLMDGALVDVSGDLGGGTALIGGNFQGRGPERNAERTYVAPTARINADAIRQGRGGRVIVWSDGATAYAGTITARGGARGGDGGFAEVSGKQTLIFDGRADLTATLGLRGTLLLDPADITVAAGTAGAVAGYSLFTDVPASSATIGAANIVTALDGANVTLQANNDITINSAINASGNAGAGNLILQAGRSITVNADINLKGGFTATANDSAGDGTNRVAGAGNFTMAAATTINTVANNGAISITSAAVAGSTNPTSGSVTLGNLNSGTGAITLAANGGAITQNGGDAITQSAGAGAVTALTTGADAITLSNTNNVITGALALTTATGNATIVNNYTCGTVVAGSTVGGNFALDSKYGNVTQTGALTVGGTTAITANYQANQQITLTQSANALAGTVTLSTTGATGHASITNNHASGLFLNGSTVGGNLTATASQGEVRANGGITVGGTTTITANSVAGQGVILDSSANSFTGTLSIDNNVAAGQVTIWAPTLSLGLVQTQGFLGLRTDTLAGTTSGSSVGGGLIVEPLTISRNVIFGSGVSALVVNGTNVSDLAPALGFSVGRPDGTGTVTWNSTSTPSIAASVFSDSGAITFSCALTLNSSLTVGANTANVAFSGTVNGAQTLTVTTGGTTAFNGAVGGTTPLGSVDLSVATGATTLNSVTTTGVQVYAGPVTLASNTTLTTTNSFVAFSGTVDGAQTLNVSAGTGTIAFSGNVGGTTPLTGLDTTGTTGIVTLRDVTTTGAQTYAGAVALGAAATLTTTNSNVTLSGTVNGAQTLAIAAGTGAVTLGSVVGGTTALTSLDTTGSTGAHTIGSVTTAGAQTYGGPVTLGAATTLTTTNSNVAFNGTVDGAQTLAVASGTGTLTITGAIGGTTAPTSLTKTGAGGTTLSAGVTTAGAQSYAGALSMTGTAATGGGTFTATGAVTLTGNTTVNSGGGNISFGSTVTGAAQTLTLNAGSTGAVTDGGTTAITVAALSVQAGSAVLTGTINGQAGALAAGQTTYVAGGAGPFTINTVSYAPVSPPPSPPPESPPPPPVTTTVSPPTTTTVSPPASPPTSPPTSPPVVVSPPASPPPPATVRTVIAAVVPIDVVTRTDTTASNSAAGTGGPATTGGSVTQNAYQTLSLSLALDPGPTLGGPTGGPTGGGGGGAGGTQQANNEGAGGPIGTATTGGGTAATTAETTSPNGGGQGGTSQVLVRGLLTQAPVARPSATPAGQTALSQSFPGFGNAGLWRN